MQRGTRLTTGAVLGMIALLMCWSLVFPTPANAQGSQGQDAVYNSSNGIVGSSSFIDASMFAQSGVDFCKVLNGILSGTSTKYPATGGCPAPCGFFARGGCGSRGPFHGFRVVGGPSFMIQ
jgi:hypothetical protein